MTRALTWDQVIEVRRLASANVSQAGLARVYGVAESTINRAVNGSTYGRELRPIDGDRAYRYTKSIQPMPCPLTGSEIQTLQNVPIATMDTAAEWMEQAAAWLAEWEPDDEYLRCVKEWRATDTTNAAD